MKVRLLILIAMVMAVAGAKARTASDASFHCAEDTLRINQILKSLDRTAPLGDRICAAAMQLADAGEDNFFSTDSVGALRINVDSFTPLSFVNNAVALAKAAGREDADWTAFWREFKDISCRRGENGGFPSIMYHTSDWISDNVARGNLKEITENFPGVESRTKSLDELSRNRGKFAALSDSANYETVRLWEMGFRTHRIPTLKREAMKKKEITDELQNGDIIILVPYGDGRDWYDMGVVSMQEDGPHLIHLSPLKHKVMLEPEPMARYAGLVTKYFQGYRIIRLTD
ncbi:MAG: DUF1460 domain-containing protein [Muribaculaceae bacterium]|nr:DUF1460 domain-containing protein [Muribaculaceae bacterium]